MMPVSPPQPLPKGSAAPAPEIINVAPGVDQVACDGGGGPLGHPLVYYSFDAGPRVECLYCDRVFLRTL